MKFKNAIGILAAACASALLTVTVHCVPVTGKNPCKITFDDGFLLECDTFSHGISSEC